MNRFAAALLCVLLFASAGHARSAPAPAEDLLVTTSEPGRPGGGLVVAQRAEPKTLDPVTALDNPSREVIRRLNADLVHINRQSQQPEPALAKSWTVSKDGLTYILHLRRGLRFSDGHPFDADDVVFSFQVYQDEKVRSVQRDLLRVTDKPISVTKLDQYTVRFELGLPYAAGDRLFDSLAMLPRHLLEKPYREGKMTQAWGLDTPPDQIAGLGPFRLKSYVPGQKIVLERNPYYWKRDSKGTRLPYLNELTFIFVPSDDAQVIRFQSGETDVISRISAENYAVLAKDQPSRGYQLYDVGPSLEFNYLVFNLNDDTAGRLPEVSRRQQWFRDLRFRQAVSDAIDRAGIVRIVYQGKGVGLWEPETPGNKLWVNNTLPQPARSVPLARDTLKAAGFSWSSDGTLKDPSGRPVEFSILASSSNSQRMQMATIIQDDLKQLGMNVHVVGMEFRAMVDRVTESHDYDAAIMGIASGDVDPNGNLNVWVSNGQTHIWNLGEKKPATPWEAEMDHLMLTQLASLKVAERKRLYDRVQQILAEQLPIICIASPNILVGAKTMLGNFKPSILDHYTLSNVDELYWRQ